MVDRHLVTVVGATGAQGGSVVRALVETDKYKIRCLTRDAKGKKAQALKDLGDNIELVTCDINKADDVKKAFKDSWAVFAVTDFWAQPEQPEVEMSEGMIMADVAASLQTPYYVFSALEDSSKISGGKISVPHIEQKAKLRDYIKEKHPSLKAIYVEPGYYMQNWINFFKPSKLDDGTRVFSAPINQQAILNMVDIEDTGAVVREILKNPDQFIGKGICICGEAIRFEDIAKVFTKVTGIPAISKTITEDEFRSLLKDFPKVAQDDLFAMYQFFEEYGLYGGKKDWTTGQKLTKLNTFEQWLKKTGWKGD